MITLKEGNIFESKCKTLVNPINCVGVMGKGLSLVFKENIPECLLIIKSFVLKT